MKNTYPLTSPANLKHLATNEIFSISNDRVYIIIKDMYIHIGTVYKYTRKGFYYIDLFGNKSYITWSNFDDVNKKDDDNLPNQLPLFPDTDEL